MIHLHVHNEYSLLDGLNNGATYAKRAKELGQKAIAITNHGNVDGNIRFQNACLEEGVHPIHGIEGYIVKDLTIKKKGEKRNHIVLIAKNEIGWQNILKMSTISFLQGFYYRPRIDPVVLLDHLEGVIILTACSSTFILEPYGIELLDELKRREFKDLFFEIMPIDYTPQGEVNRQVIEISKKYSWPLVATNDCHYVDEDGAKAQEVLLAIQTKKRWTDQNRWKIEAQDLYLKSRSHMVKSFKKQGAVEREIYLEAINNTEIIYELVKDFTLKEVPVDLPLVPGYEDDDPELLFKDLCRIGFKKKVADKNKDEKIYQERLDEELGIIIRQGFVKYFLIVWELVNWCKKNDILTGPGRGSAGGSLVCYLLNITEVDPIEFNLIFARFISPARIDLPDIDMDFEDRKRHLIREHLEELYGKDNVCGVSTFSTMKGRGAIRDVSRVFSVPLAEVGKAAKSIVVRSGGDERSDYTIEDAFNTFEDGMEFKKKYPHVVDVSVKLEGQTKTKGMHAAAMVISNENLKDGKRCVIQYGKDKTEICNWDKYDIESVGLMKLDVLGLNMLTILNEARKMVKENHGVDIDYYNLPLDDERCYKEFSSGNNVGCFQVGSLGLRRFCQNLGIDNFDMLVNATSLYRPGTLRSGQTTEFVKRKRGEVKWDSIHPIIDELTKDTFGIILYQEQVMRFMYDLGGLGWKTCDTVRKVISKSQGDEQFRKFKGLFAEGCVKKETLDKKTAEELWDQLSSFGSYSFNKSHAVEYSLISYWDMWVKLNYPEEFICASLTCGSEDKKEELIQEAFRLGIKVRMPKVGVSDTHDWIIKNNILYCPFVEIKGIGDKTAEKLKSLFNNKKDNFTDEEKKKIGSKFYSILEKINAFEDCDYEDDLAETVEEYFKFSFIKNRLNKFKNLVSLFKEHLEILSLKEGFQIEDKRINLFGFIEQVKYSYRSNISESKNISGDSSGLGGVYGNFKDDTDFCMLVFKSDIYSKKKNLIEHCDEKFLLATVEVNKRHQSLMCKDAWFEEEIISGELGDLDLKLAQKRRFNNPEVLNCGDCDLRTECKSPVLPSKGVYNAMIIGEAPRKDDDKEGKVFSGRPGEVLFKEINKYGFKRRDFNATNLVKCFPSDSKNPSKRHIKKCSKWIEEEIQNIKPFVILALGKAPLNYFTGLESGIMDKNGTTEWGDKYGCWICWCISPASVAYHEENKELFRIGIENFINKFKNLGGL